MEIIFSEEFKKDFQKIKDKALRLRIIKQLKKLAETPEAGKPLRYGWKNHRSLRVPPFRIIYRLENEKIIINCFDHRKEVYDCSYILRQDNMKPKDLGKLKEKLKKKLKKDKAKKEDEWEIDRESDYPVHEKYTKEEPVKD